MMLCISAVFAVVRCPSVCHIRAFYPDGWRYCPALIPNSKGNPSAEVQNPRGWENFCNFQLKSPSISEMVRDRPMVAMER